MREIKFNEGQREYRLNGDSGRVIAVQLDPNLLTRLSDAQKRIEKLSKKLSGSSAEAAVRTADREIRELLNTTFNADICTVAFGNANPLTPVPGHGSLLEAFLDAFLPVLTEDIYEAFPESRDTGVSGAAQKYLDDKKNV